MQDTDVKLEDAALGFEKKEVIFPIICVYAVSDVNNYA